MKHVSKNLKDTENIARDVVKQLLKKNPNIKAQVVGLYGDLGAGKTAFTQALAKELNIKDKIVSPTFVIMKKFSIPEGKHKILIHIDAYRLKKGEELEKLGWADIISDPNNLVLIDWPELVADIMPKRHLNIKIKHIDEKTREFDVCV